jgi:ribokinase
MSRVVVCGSINIDLVATVARLPTPGETVAGSGFVTYPGGKGANQAVAAAKGGAEVVMLGAVGADTYGAELRSFLDEHGVDTSRLVERSGLPTGTALILVDQAGENVIAVVPGANATVDAVAAAGMKLGQGDVLVSQFETPVDATLAFFGHGKRVGATRMLNPAPAAEISRELLELVDVLVVNETELASITGCAIPHEVWESDVHKAAATLAEAGFSGSLVVTLGARGVAGVTGGEAVAVDGHDVLAVDTTGAGDCFVGYLAAELARGAQLDAALRHANAAGALAVQRHGAGSAMPHREQVEALLKA